MRITHLQSNTQVSAYVDRILVLEHDQLLAPFALPLFANGAPTLVFTSAKGTIGQAKTTHLTLVGQTIAPETLKLTGKFLLIAYFFKPYALLPLFGITAAELTDRPVDLGLVTSKRTRKLQERLLNADSPGHSLALLDQYIAGLMADAKAGPAPIIYAATKITLHPSPEILATVQKELHLTERTFQRLFEKHIGLSPNLYRRVSQFNAAFQQLNQRKFIKLSDIAFRNGYADQSHYVRSFKEFTHITPKNYLNFGA